MSVWNTINTFKENLSQIASEVLDAAEERDIEDAIARRARSQADHHTRDDSATNGLASSDPEEADSQELRMKCENLEARGKELFSQLQAKERAFIAVNERRRQAVDETERLKEALSKIQLELSTSNAQLRDEREHAESSKRQREGEKAHQMENGATANSEVPSEDVRTRDETIARLQEKLLQFEEERIATQTQAVLEQLRNTKDQRTVEADNEDANSKQVDILSEKLRTLQEAHLSQTAELTRKLRTLEEAHLSETSELTKKLEAVVLEKDKAVKNLSRLKQHLLEKENADSEKMDRDSEQISMLEELATVSKARVLQLEQALFAQTEEAKRNYDELKKSRLEVDILQAKLNDCFLALESKDVEVANLQSVLGHNYAEIEAKERLGVELRAVKEEIRKLRSNLEDARQTIDLKEKEKEQCMEKLQLAEKKALTSYGKMQKTEQDMARLRHALEESMIRLNRMSSDSDFSVDRRLVIKLLVTYFEKGHSREVLDLMSRILGFSDDDKRRVGLAHQNAGKPGVVRSVLGLPGRVVGGLLGSGPEPSEFPSSSSNQSFADLWIDFLLKESEERDKKERAQSEMKLATALHYDELPSDSLQHVEASDSSSSRNLLQEASSSRSMTNGYARDDIFATDLGNAEEKKGHRRVYSRS